jgi:hypothetical protein
MNPIIMMKLLMISATETASATENPNLKLPLFNGFTLDGLLVKYFVQKLQKRLKPFERTRENSLSKKSVSEKRGEDR